MSISPVSTTSPQAYSAVQPTQSHAHHGGGKGAQIRQQIQALEQQIASATTPEAKAPLQAQLNALQAQVSTFKASHHGGGAQPPQVSWQAPPGQPGSFSLVA